MISSVQGSGGPAAVVDSRRSAAGAGPASEPVSIDRGFVAMLFLLSTEAMFFAGLISSFLILKSASALWPPPGQPRLPAAVTALNSIVLIASGLTMWRALVVIRRGSVSTLARWLLATGGLGILFLAVQGSEWVRLISHGLSISSGIYGSTFYTLIGAHGLHVAAALIVLLWVLGNAMQRRYSRADHNAVRLCLMYWLFVVGLWPVLYVLVYLS